MGGRPGVPGLVARSKQGAPAWAAMFPQVPRPPHRLLAEDRAGQFERATAQLLREQARQSRALAWIAVLLATQLGLIIFLLLQ